MVVRARDCATGDFETGFAAGMGRADGPADVAGGAKGAVTDALASAGGSAVAAGSPVAACVAEAGFADGFGRVTVAPRAFPHKATRAMTPVKLGREDSTAGYFFFSKDRKMSSTSEATCFSVSGPP